MNTWHSVRKVKQNPVPLYKAYDEVEFVGNLGLTQMIDKAVFIDNQWWYTFIFDSNYYAENTLISK